MCSWQEDFLRTFEFGEQPSTIALCSHDERCPLQLLDGGSSICDIAELSPMLAHGVLEFRKAKFHLQHSG